MKTIDVFYLVPADRTPNPQYIDRIKLVVSQTRIWYYSHLNGSTFEVNRDFPIILRSEKMASDFTDKKVAMASTIRSSMRMKR